MHPRLPANLFAKSNLIPPHLGDPRLPSDRSPYNTTFEGLAKSLSFNHKRIELLKGLVAYRKALRAAGITGYQWIDGSFVEHKEGRLTPDSPNDIDVLTIIKMPHAPNSKEHLDFIQKVKHLFDVPSTKALYHCDAYLFTLFENLGASPGKLVESVFKNSHYWYGLFSHSRDGESWKGILQLPLESADDDASVLTLLGGVAIPAGVTP